MVLGIIPGDKIFLPYVHTSSVLEGETHTEGITGPENTFSRKTIWVNHFRQKCVEMLNKHCLDLMFLLIIKKITTSMNMQTS